MSNHSEMDFFRITYSEDKPAIYLRQGTNINSSVTPDGLTPLHVVVSKKWQPREVQLLLSHGANVNARDLRGRTPLHLVPETSDLTSIAWLLLEAGADPNARTLRGESVIGVASRLNRWAIVSLLLNYGADVNDASGRWELFEPPLHTACRTGNLKAVVMLLDKGADVNARGYAGRIALHTSVETPTELDPTSNYRVIIKKLVRSGCNFNTRDSHGKTPLHVACANGSVVGALALLLRFADIDIRDNNGNTPAKVLDRLGESQNNVDVIAMLMLKHAEVMRLIGLRKLSREADEVNQLLRKYVHEEVFAGIVETCREEFERIRTIRLDPYTTLDQLLTTSVTLMSHHFLNPDLKKIVKSDQYPIFGHILKQQYRNGCARASLLEEAFQAFESLTLQCWHPSCMEVIFSYLEDSHLRELIEASNL